MDEKGKTGRLPPDGRRQCGGPGVKPSKMRNTWPRIVAKKNLIKKKLIQNFNFYKTVWRPRCEAKQDAEHMAKGCG